RLRSRVRVVTRLRRGGTAAAEGDDRPAAAPQRVEAVVHREERAAKINVHRRRELRRLVGANRPDGSDDGSSADETEELVEVGGVAAPGVVISDVERAPAVAYARKRATRRFECCSAARDEHETCASFGEHMSRFEADPHRAAREQDTPARETAHA